MLFSSRIFLSSSQKRLLHTGMGIYVFHKISLPPPQTLDPFEFTPAANFESKLRALIEAGLTPSTLDASRSTSRKKFAITFDDGYASIAEQALPILHRHKVRTITFLIAKKLGTVNDWDIAKGDVPERLMDETQIKTWLTAGQHIGSHSLTHQNLRKIPLTQAREEITASRKHLEDTFGVPVEHFCYPYGSYNEAIRDLVIEAGYKTASTVNFGVYSPVDSPFELNRITPLTTGELFRKAIHRLRRRITSRT